MRAFISLSIVQIVWSWALLSVSVSVVAATKEDLSQSVDLADAVQLLRGDDDRLVPYDVTDETAVQQAKLCPQVIPAAVKAFETSKPKDTTTIALEALILCITDNPQNRATFAESKLHKLIVKHLEKANDNAAIATIGQLIYISVYGNQANHDGYTQAGAIKALGKVILDDNNKDTSSIAKMWAAAALQNMAASYCKDDDNGDDDPGCFWDWSEVEEGNGSKTVLEINEEESGVLFIDSTITRQEIFQQKGLVDKLMELSCTGPVQGVPNPDKNPLPTLASRSNPPHDNFVAWAATGALQNMALLPQAAAYLQSHLMCLCVNSFSVDWLESDKASTAMHFLRPQDGCWFYLPEGVSDGSQISKTLPICVDRLFLDKENQTCDDFGEKSTKDECSSVDLASKKPASEQCCGCQGGDKANGWELSKWVEASHNPDEFFYEDEL